VQAALFIGSEDEAQFGLLRMNPQRRIVGRVCAD